MFTQQQKEDMKGLIASHEPLKGLCPEQALRLMQLWDGNWQEWVALIQQPPESVHRA